MLNLFSVYVAPSNDMIIHMLHGNGLRDLLRHQVNGLFLTPLTRFIRFLFPTFNFLWFEHFEFRFPFYPSFSGFICHNDRFLSTNYFYHDSYLLDGLRFTTLRTGFFVTGLRVVLFTHCLRSSAPCKLSFRYCAQPALVSAR